MRELFRLLSETELLYEASEAVVPKGDTKALKLGASGLNDFVALVKICDGRLWVLEGSRKYRLTEDAWKRAEMLLANRYRSWTSSI